VTLCNSKMQNYAVRHQDETRRDCRRIVAYSGLPRLKADGRSGSQPCGTSRWIAPATGHSSHKEQASMIRRYIIWRNNHTYD
jgi:hypothetical protein